jgi:hypothetical protein
MDRIVRYAFCTAGLVLTLGWLGSVAKGYLPSPQHARDAAPFNAAAREGASVIRNGRTVPVVRPPFPSLNEIFAMQLKQLAQERNASQLDRNIPAVLW